MRLTRRCWTLVGTAIALGGLSVLTARPVLLVAGATIAGFVLAGQYRFLRDLERTDRGLTVDLQVGKRHVSRDAETTVVVEVTRSSETSLELLVDPRPPISATSPPESQRRIVVSGRGTDRTTFPLGWPVVGRASFGQTRVTATDDAGLFRETVRRGPTPSVTVEARRPRNLHVGEGGEQIPVAAGEHRAGTFGAGLDPAELRPYTVGDDASDIDWKATARLADPYVREYEAETDRRSALLVDHRASLDVGPPGETKFQYLREVALALTDQARALEDPLGCYSVSDGGLTGEYRPSTAADQYRAIRRHLHDLAASPRTGEEGSVTTAPTDSGEVLGTRRAPNIGTDTITAGQKAARIATDSSAYGDRLRPFFEDSRAYVERFEDQPLFEVATTHLTQLGGPLWTFVFTDDDRPAELRETVRRLRGDSGHVVVFIAPTVLYDPGGLVDLEAAYEEYVDFESLRRDLARLDRVSAYEVGPGDRLDAILDAGRR